LLFRGAYGVDSDMMSGVIMMTGVRGGEPLRRQDQGGIHGHEH